MTPQETVERALALSKADGCVVLATERSEVNLRWANNTLTTNGSMRSREVAVISVVGEAVAVAQRSAVTADDLEDLVRASEQAARDAGPNEDAAPLAEPDGGSEGWDEPPAETSIGTLATVSSDLGEAFGRAAGRDRLLFGYAEHAVESQYLGSSTGVRLRHVQPTGRIDINGKSRDYARSAWVGQGSPDFADVEVEALDRELGRRLDWADRSVELPAGRYETLLPPSAVGDLFLFLYAIASGARAADEGRTVFSKPGGGNRIGERLSPLPVTLRSDPRLPGLECAPFLATTRSEEGTVSVFDNGLPLGSTEWIRDGVLSELMRTRAYATKTDTRARPYVDTISPNPDDFQLLRGFKRGESYRSFPSGHTLAAFAAAAAVSAETSRWWSWASYTIGPLMYGGAAAVGVSRMYNNRHWASDVILGAALGTFAGTKVVRYHATHPGNRIDKWLINASFSPSNPGQLSLSILPVIGRSLPRR